VFVAQGFGFSAFGTTGEAEFVKTLRENLELQGVVRNMLEYSPLHQATLVHALELTRELLADIESGSVD
jgi:hypothetical protein